MKAIQDVKMLAAKKNISLTYIAQYLSQKLNKKYTLNNLSNKLHSDTIKYSEMKLIAEALGCELIFKEKE